MQRATGPHDRNDRQISSAEAAHRLGVKRETLYAYVSRGYLHSHREPGQPGSTFSLAEVEALHHSTTRARSSASRPFRFPAITTHITRIADGELHYRGHNAITLARTSTFEAVAGLLWTGELAEQSFQAPPPLLDRVRPVLDALPRTSTPASRMRVAVTLAGDADRRAADLTAGGVRRSASTAVAVMLHSLNPNAQRDAETGSPSPAVRLWHGLTPQPMNPQLTAALDVALVLLADHGLAASTVAARVTASARATPYAVIAAGLAALDSPLHGATGRGAHDVLSDVLAGRSPESVAGPYLRHDGHIPGFSDTDTDPRAPAIIAALTDLPAAQPALAAAQQLQEVLGHDQDTHPTIGLALAILTAASGMPNVAATAITSIARAAGWTAHAAEEYDETPMRWRARDTYTDTHPRPQRGLSPSR